MSPISALTKQPMTIEQIEALEHIFIGPTWRKTLDGAWDLPKHTLGWEIIGWCSEWLNAETSTDERRVRWSFTPEQMRFILHWYAIDDDGQFIHRTGVLQRMKGWG